MRTDAAEFCNINLRAAQERWPGMLGNAQIEHLKNLVSVYRLAVSIGDLQLLKGNWYVTHSGLLRLARRKHCSGIHTEVVPELSDAFIARWVVKATVFKTPRSKGFVGYGDADPSNVSPLVRGAELRIAETRAVNRALRKAYGIGTCSLEELGASFKQDAALQSAEPTDKGNSQVRLRDRLLLLIRKHRLDAEQVKRYAAHFCGTAALREASREQVQKLVDHLETVAVEGRDRLIAELAHAECAPPESARAQQDKAEQSKEAA